MTLEDRWLFLQVLGGFLILVPISRIELSFLGTHGEVMVTHVSVMRKRVGTVVVLNFRMDMGVLLISWMGR